MSWYLQTPNCAYLSNTRANCGFSCWAPLLSFLEFCSIKKAGQWLGRASEELPWSRRKKCEIHYKFQGENHGSSGATFTDMKTTKLWKHYVSRGFWKYAIWGWTLKLVQKGPPKSTNFWTPFISKVCIRVQVLRPFWKSFLTWNGKGVERNGASKHSGEVGSTQSFSLKITPAKDHNSFCEILW